MKYSESVKHNTLTNIFKELAKLSDISIPFKSFKDYDFTFGTCLVCISDYDKKNTHYSNALHKALLNSLLDNTENESSKYQIKSISMQILLFLHELGHVQTATKTLLIDSGKLLIEYRNSSEYKQNSLEQIQQFYFQLPVEKKASQWAVQFIQENYNQIISIINKS